MNIRRTGFSLLKAATLLALCALAACNRNSPPAQTPPATAPATAPAPAPLPAAPQAPAIAPGTEVPVASVNSVMLKRVADTPGALIIDVSGMTLSHGWTNPRLAEDTES